MNDMMFFIISIIFVIVSISIVGTAVYIIVQSLRSKDAKFKISTKTLFQIYLTLISFLTLIIAVIGGATAIKATLSYQFGIPFSYTLYKANDFTEAKVYDPNLLRENFSPCYEGDPMVFGINEYCFNTQLQKTDLINGITIFVSMVILFSIHQFALSRIKEKERLQWLNKIYTFASLILYSIIGLVSIPTSIYQLTNFLLAEPEKYVHSTPEAPAMTLAIAFLSVPLWVFFLKNTSDIKEED